VPQDPKLLQYPFDPMRYIRRGPSGSARYRARRASQIGTALGRLSAVIQA
jgi:hypothetical protein